MLSAMDFRISRRLKATFDVKSAPSTQYLHNGEAMTRRAQLVALARR